MKSYELNPGEVELVVRALRYALKDTHTFTKDHAGLCALIDKLDPPRVKKAGWMNVYKNPITGQKKYGPVHHSKEDALIAGMDENNHSWGKSIDCLRVEWEE